MSDDQTQRPDARPGFQDDPRSPRERSVFLNIEVRHLQAATVLAEELNFSRAAQRLIITQPGLSKRIKEVEELQKVRLFARSKGQTVELTAAGCAFVKEAQIALFHLERAINLARNADPRSNSTLMIGYSPHTDPSCVSTVLAMRLPLFPSFRVRLLSRLATNLVGDVMAGVLDLALVIAPSEGTKITTLPFARTPLYAILPESHPCARRRKLFLRDLEKDQWILNGEQVHPKIRSAILETTRNEGIAAKDAHDVFTEQQAFQLVAENAGVAIVMKPSATESRTDRIVVKPLSDESLCFETCLVMRSDDNSKLTNEFARSFLRRVPRHGFVSSRPDSG
jgi:DNA-binding transcriptional LysR family regulator